MEHYKRVGVFVSGMIIIGKHLFRLNKLKRKLNIYTKKNHSYAQNATEASSPWKTKPFLRDKNNKHKSITHEAKIKKRKTLQS